MKNSSKTLYLVGIATLLLWVVFEFISLEQRQQNSAIYKQDADLYALEISQTIQRQVDLAIWNANSVVHFLNTTTEGLSKSNPQIQPFLDQITTAKSGLKNLSIAIGTTIEFASPLENNQTVIGFDYKSLPAQWPDVQQAIETQKAILSGPVQLVQGGTALIYRLPYYREGQYQGIIAAVIDINQLLEQLSSILSEDAFLTNIEYENQQTIRSSATLYEDKNFDSQTTSHQHLLETADLRWIISLQSSSLSTTPFYAFYTWAARSLFLGILLLCYLSISLYKKHKQLANRYQQLVKNSDDIFWTLDPEKQAFTYFSPSMAKLSQYSPEEALKLPFEQHLAPEFRQQAVDLIKKMAREFETHGSMLNHRLEYQHLRKDGSTIWAEASGQMVQRADGKTLVQGITRINDEEKKFRLALQQKEERLQKLIETKDRLLAIISHDLKTPVHAAKGILNLLQTEQQHFSNEERDEMIALLKKSNEQQEELIEDLLTWSQTQNDRIKVHYQRINLQNVAKQAIKSSKLRADQKNIEIATNIDEDIAVQADLFMLETILRNLISNAVKFTNAGGKITIGSELKADGQKKVRIYVKDEGIGMPSNLIKDIQKQRYRRSQKGTEQESGTGMGLMITQEFIKNLDSSLQINSKLAEGSTFSFLLDASEKETH